MQWASTRNGELSNMTSHIPSLFFLSEFSPFTNSAIIPGVSSPLTSIMLGPYHRNDKYYLVNEIKDYQRNKSQYQPL